MREYEQTIAGVGVASEVLDCGLDGRLGVVRGGNVARDLLLRQPRLLAGGESNLKHTLLKTSGVLGGEDKVECQLARGRGGCASLPDVRNDAGAILSLAGRAGRGVDVDNRDGEQEEL